MATNNYKRPVPRDLTKVEWKELLNKVSEKAVEEAREMGLSIAIAKDGKVFNLHPNGELEYIEDFPEVKRKTTKKRFTIE